MDPPPPDDDAASPLRCAVCFERFRVPVTLPGCGHSFCSHCLHGFWNCAGSTRTCPVCRADHRGEMPCESLVLRSLVDGEAVRREEGPPPEPAWRRRLTQTPRLVPRPEQPALSLLPGPSALLRVQWTTSRGTGHIGRLRVFGELPPGTREQLLLTQWGFREGAARMPELMCRSKDEARSFARAVWADFPSLHLDGDINPRHCFMPWVRNGLRVCACGPLTTCFYCTHACCAEATYAAVSGASAGTIQFACGAHGSSVSHHGTVFH